MQRRHWTFAFLLVGLFTAPVLGADLPPEAIRISYTSHVPKQILTFRPKSAITRFYGVTEIQHQRLAVHFYALQPMRKNQEMRTVKRESRLDVFVVQQNRHSTSYQRLSSTPITVQSRMEEKPRFSMATMWLDPATKKQPIFVVRQFQRNVGGYEAPDLLFTFAQGIKGQASIAQFLTFWSESLSESSVHYGLLDENGRLTVVLYHRYGNGIDLTAYKWNGKNFAEFQKVDDSAESPIYHVWDGKKFVEEDLRKQVRPPKPTS